MTEEKEPDYRFTLANERTFLAWIRTALGLLAGGVAVRQLVPRFTTPGATVVLAVACVGLAAILAATSYPRWRRIQRAMRVGSPLPRTRLLIGLSISVLLLAVFTAVVVIRG